MTTRAHLRRSALRLPGVEETPDHGALVFAVRGEAFAWATADGAAELAMSPQDASATLERFASAEPLTRGGEQVGVRVPLAAVNGMELNALLEKAWRSKAPPEHVALRRAAARGEAPTGPDALPRSIGKPATRALLAAGITTLSEAVARPDEELLALHGVGPRAVRLLREAAAQKG
ncbi:MAG TPA: hypothetical protein VFF08_03655 [Trueperaceae bacterium]|jgi:hypothetical protein|nr:hypothetical protein [Trueperaceae bacterium]